MQRVDLIVDGRVRNVNQRSDLPAFEKRVLSAMQTANRVEVVRTAPPKPPIPPAPALNKAGQFVVFSAEVEEEDYNRYLGTNPRWQLAVSADRSYRTATQGELIKRALGAGRTVRPWCDCRGPETDPPGTPFEAALEMAHDLGLAEPIGQAELPMEYERAIGAGARVVVGNPSGLTHSQVTDATSRCERGDLAFIGELEWQNPNYSALGIPICSGMFFVWLGDGIYRPVSSFVSAVPTGLKSGYCVYHLRRLQAADLALLT